jgi:hypothetical protein
LTASELTGLIAALRSGDMSLEAVAERFRNRQWPDAAAPEPSNFLELAANSMRDPDPDAPGSFDEVTAAYDRGEITREQYRALAHAAAEAINAQAHRERDARGG